MKSELTIPSDYSPTTNPTIWIMLILSVMLFSLLATEPALAAPGKVKWSIKVGDESIKTCAAIGSDGTIYVVNDKKIHAINPNGTKKWDTKDIIKSDINSSPAIGIDGTIYIGAEDNKLHAINPDGTEKWNTKDIFNECIDTSSAIASDGTIYVVPDEYKFSAINPDGTEKWFLNISPYSHPAIGSDGTIYVGSSNKKLYAINPNGTEKWNTNTIIDDLVSSISIGSDGTIYAGSKNKKLYAINPDGTEKWNTKTIIDRPIQISVIGSDGTIYVLPTNTVLYAIKPDGTKKWKEQFISGEWLIFSTPAIGSDGTIYLGSCMGFFAIDPNGTTKWQDSSSFDSELTGRTTIGSDGTIYIGSVMGTLYAIEGSSTGLATSPWPKFGQNIKNTNQKLVGCVVPSPEQASGITIAISAGCAKEIDATELNRKYKSGDFTPKSKVQSFNATINSNGGHGTFRFSSTTIPTGKVSDLTLMKFYDTKDSSTTYKKYALSGPEYNQDGYWWVTDKDGNHMGQTDPTILGNLYYVYFVIKDNGDYDEDRDLGKIADPVALGLGSGSSGCTLNPQATFSVEWLLLIMAPLLIHLRSRFKNSSK